MIIDGFTSQIVAIPFIVLMIFTDLKNNLHFQVFTVAFVSTFFICKDLILSGKSIGKRISNLQILDIHNNEPSNLKLICRNLFSFLWPVEILFCCLNPERKLGDIVFGTKVSPSNLEEKRSCNVKIAMLYFSITLLVIFIVFDLIMFLAYSSSGLVRLLFMPI
ncbi:RDD family protein [Dysgonomonas alginatilytica]|uniref:RDD family protein n=2 Tax=Dysgonomonas alginatilytica TaxID=1605892 RepID=A0A2V3PKQ7_9BACT|nr:RDD family protein [Dysgonomonas alginatilytica]